MSQEKIRWRDQYSIGVAELDKQHQRLLDLLNKVNALDREKPGREPDSKKIATALEMLNEYAAYHFLSEEDLMREHLPSDETYRQHMLAHRAYWSKITAFKRRLAQSDGLIFQELVEFLNHWWNDHILNTDKAMGQELNRCGIH